MPTDLTAIDLATLNTVQVVIVAALRNQCCQWEQQSSDAAADGCLSNALILENWAFAADLLASKVGSEFSTLFCQALDTRLNWSSKTRSEGDQLLDASTLEVAAAKSEPLPALKS
jgi:hypothetical protein